MVSSRSFVVSISLFTISPCFVAASGSIALPHFTFQTLVNDEGEHLDLHEFRSHLDHVTNNHLSDFIEKVLVVDFGGSKGGFQGLHLESTVRRIHDRFTTDPRAVIQTTFEGTAIFSDTDDSSAPNTLMSEDLLHIIIAQALIGDAYWNLMHRFIEDPILANVDNLDIVIDESVLNDADQSLSYDEPDKDGGVIAVLAIFSTIMCLATVFLLLLAYRRYTTESDLCCSQSKNSDMTDEDDDDIKADEDFDDEALAATPPQRKKKRRVKPSEKLVLDLPSLDCIKEEGEDEEEMTTVDLDNLFLI